MLKKFVAALAICLTLPASADTPAPAGLDIWSADTLRWHETRPGGLPHYEGAEGDTIIIGVATAP